MSRRLMIPVDGSDQSSKALEHALSVHPDASIVLVHVVDPRSWISADDYGEVVYSDELEESTFERADELLAEMRERVEDAGADAETVRLVGQPADSLVSYAKEHDVDQIVMGSHGRTGLDRLLLGSVAESVTRRSPAPVTIVH